MDEKQNEIDRKLNKLLADYDGLFDEARALVHAMADRSDAKQRAEIRDGLRQNDRQRTAIIDQIGALRSEST